MKTLQFEGVKVSLKQDKTGYVLNLSLHPDDIPEDLLRDYVGSRYQVVMVRIDQNEQPMDRQANFEGDKAVRTAGILCKDPKFWKYLYSQEHIFDEDMDDATEWVRSYLNVESRSDLKTNHEARILLERLNREYQAWLQKD
jgi:hypothetical protein